jgi:hypothetical protein
MIMPSSAEYLISSQDPTGGWGYHRDQKPSIEATALAILALRDQSIYSGEFQKCISWLLSCQHEDGGWGIYQDDFESGWQTAWALIALAHLNQGQSAMSAAVLWLTHVPTAQIGSVQLDRVTNLDDQPAVNLVWPWLPGQGGWIVPTALAVLALTGQELSPLASLRIDAAHAYFKQNRTPIGGWSYGNASPLDTIVNPRAHQTATVLMALTRTNPQEVRKEDVSALKQSMREDQGVLSLAAGLTALHMLGEQDDESSVLLNAKQLPDGSWEQRPFSTAWAMLALRGFL